MKLWPDLLFNTFLHTLAYNEFLHVLYVYLCSIVPWFLKIVRVRILLRVDMNATLNFKGRTYYAYVYMAVRTDRRPTHGPYVGLRASFVCAHACDP